MAATLTSDNELTYASFPIEKVEQTADGNVLVWGKATDDSVDSDQQIVDPDFAAKAIDEFFTSGPNIRVQHQPQRDPAGVGVSYERDGNSHWVKSRIIEPVAKQLVLGGALRAYSVGIARPTIVRDHVARGGRITDGQIVEISLVDRPANKNCGIQLVKGIDKSGSTVLMTKVFGADDLLEKSVTLTLPADVQVGFSPADLAKIVARRNGVTKAATLDDAVVLPPASRAEKGKKKALRAAAAAAGVVPDDEKQGGSPSTGGAAMGSPQAAPASLKDEDDEVDARVHAHLEDTQNALSEAIHDQDLDYTHEDKAADGTVEKKKLTSRARRALSSSAFVFPEERRYPIHDRSHARNALARVSQHGTPDEKAKVRAAVARRYPGIEQEKKTQKKISKALAKQGAAMPSPQAPAASMKKDKALCGSCGAMQNKEHAFCSECGKAMIGAPEIAKNHDFMCLKCGHELDKGEKFCPECGTPNPGYNPMADLKIPANKSEGSRVADDVTQAETQDPAVAKADEPTVTKKVKPKKGKKGKPFGGSQAPPFGKKPDDGDNDADDDDAKKGMLGTDAPLTEAKVRKGKNKPPKKITDGSTPGSASGARGETGEKPQPSPRHDQVGFEYDRDAAKGASPDVATQLRLKALGMDTAMGYAHDLTCAAYSWDDVAKSYPSGLALLDAGEWQQKANLAAATAPLPEAQAMSRVGQAAFAIKSAQLQDLIDVKGDLHKAFKDANPGPGSAPTPGEICASSYSRPHITAGRASYGAHYSGPHSAPVPPEGGMSAQSFHREPLHGQTSTSPANIDKGRAPVPDPPGVVMNLDYSSIMKEQVMAAMDAMHTHFDRIFPGVCPMNSSLGHAAHPVAAAKAETGEITKKVSKDGMTKKQRAKRDAKLTRQVMKGKMPLDQARIKMGKKPVTSPEPLKPLKGEAVPEIVKGVVTELKSPDVLTRKTFAAALRKSDKARDKEIAELRTLVSALADQPDPGTQPWKGIAMNPMRTKSAGPAGVQSVAEAAERSQMMVMHQLEQTARNSTNPAEREAAWQQVNKMKGLF